MGSSCGLAAPIQQKQRYRSSVCGGGCVTTPSVHLFLLQGKDVGLNIYGNSEMQKVGHCVSNETFKCLPCITSSSSVTSISCVGLPQSPSEGGADL